MKKLLILALATLPVLFACNKSDSQSGFASTPKFDKNSAKIVISTPIQVTTKGNQTVSLREINFLRSGRYVAEAEMFTKADAETVILAGTYVMEGENYKVSGDLNTVISTTSNSITIGGTTSNATVTHSNITPGSTQDKISRTWKLDFMLLSFDKMGANVRFDSINKAVDRIKATDGVNLTSDIETSLRNHEIGEISIDNGEICVTFQNAQPYKGAFNVSGNSFSYDFSGVMDGNLFNAKASGSIEFSDGQAIVSLTLNSDIQGLGNGSAKIYLKEV